MGTRHRRLAVPTVAAVGRIAALALAGCGGGTGSSSGGATTGTPPTGTSQTATSPTPAESGPAESGPLYEHPATMLAAARDEFGEIEVSVLYVYADEAMLWHVDPDSPRTSTLSHTYRDGAWTDRSSLRHATTGRTLSLDEIDPDTLRTAAANAPATLGLEPDEVEVEHVAVGTGETDEQEYVVAVTTDEGLGSVVFDHGLQVMETTAPH